MPEVAHAGEDERDIVRVADGDGARVLDRTARLDDGRHACEGGTPHMFARLLHGEAHAAHVVPRIAKTAGAERRVAPYRH